MMINPEHIKGYDKNLNKLFLSYHLGCYYCPDREKNSINYPILVVNAKMNHCKAITLAPGNQCRHAAKLLQ